MRDHTLFLDTTFTPLVAAFQYEMTLSSRPTFTLTPLTFSRWSLLRYDTWQGGGIIGAGSCVNNISSCPPSIQSFWVNYGNRMVSILQALPSQHGGYLSNCQVGFFHFVPLKSELLFLPVFTCAVECAFEQCVSVSTLVATCLHLSTRSPVFISSHSVEQAS